MNARFATVLLLAGSACASSTPSPGPAAGDIAAARAAAEKLVAEQYSAIERGDLEAWGAPLAPGALLLGTDPKESYAGKDAIVAALVTGASARMRSDVKRSYRSNGSQRIGVSADGRAAWVADEIAYTITPPSPEGTKNIAFRMTELVAEEGGRWSILAACYSVAVPDEVAFAAPREPQAPLPDAVQPGAEPIAAIIRKMDDTPSHFAGLFSDRPDVFLFGTAPEERVEGGPEVQRFTRQGEPPGKARVVRTGGIAAGIAPSGSAGWAAYTATLTVPRGDGAEVSLPVRVFAVFVEEGGAWTKVQEHVSLPVPD